MASPEFGVERRGAPVLAYARVSDRSIYVRTRIYEPRRQHRDVRRHLRRLRSQRPRLP